MGVAPDGLGSYRWAGAMPLVVNPAQVDRKSRIVALRLVLLTLRCMENWKHDVDDCDRAMILVAVAAITAERILRGDHSGIHATLDEPLPAGLMARCNVSSIAGATGLNRETTRRKVDSLIEKGLLVRLGNGTITFAPGVIQEQSTQELVRRQLDGIVRTANDLVHDGVLEFTKAEAGDSPDCG
jgi:hypothetical protein